MKPSRLLLVAFVVAISLASFGMAQKKYVITVRFYAEANPNDSDRFSSAVKLVNPPREAFIERLPVISERNIKAMYPFPASDGTMGCAFTLDDSGRIRLEVASSDHRGKAMVALVGTKTGTHQVVDMIIDKPVRDGIINIPHGLTELEITAMRKQWKVLGDPNDKRRD